MSADTLTITAFLEQRLAEDEAVAKAADAVAESGGRWWVDGPAQVSRKFWVYATGEKFKHESMATHIARHDPTRALAECAVKRQLIEDHPPMMTFGGWSESHVLRTLASVYADHEDYRAEWAL